jgi:hypothetical protein
MSVEILGPVKFDDPLILNGTKCPICEQPFAPRDKFVMVSIGPDPDDDEGVRNYLTKSGTYNARARCIHDTCLIDVDPEFYV